MHSEKCRMLYLPLDERPCNAVLPKMMACCNSQMHLITPPKTLLGNKKTPADLEQLWDFLCQNMPQCNAAVLSAEMLLFGGLLPSRVHHLTVPQLEQRLEQLKRLKHRFPYTKLYVFQLIMRTPRYNSSDEEPDYYEYYGERLFRRAYLIDKQQRLGLQADEAQQLAQLQTELPAQVIADYEQRRAVNRTMLEKMLALLADGTVDSIFIPQDDSCEYGYTAQDQRIINQRIAQLGLEDKVFLHPGADEAGAEMIARAYLDWSKRKPRVYCLFSHVASAKQIPLYEDRPMLTSIRQHIAACGCQECEHPKLADFVLAVHTPYTVMKEAFEEAAIEETQPVPQDFLQFIERCLYEGLSVALADCAYANGGDMKLIDAIVKQDIWYRLISYKGWNTTCNTIGTSLAQALLCQGQENPMQVELNVLYHLLDDGLYQAKVRSQLISKIRQNGGDIFDVGDRKEEYERHVAKQLYQESQRLFNNDVISDVLTGLKAELPWNRTFEIFLDW